MDSAAGKWLLSAEERGNAATTLPPWTEGNLARPLVHGAAYFDRLVEVVEAMQAGDHLYFTDWRGDPDQRLRENGPTVAELLTRALRRGVCVRGLVWRSHWDALEFSKEQNRALDHEVEGAGGQVVLDQRVRALGSHHQKFVVARHRDDPARDVAFVGGIDLCHGRRDDAAHGGDPQTVAMAADYGPRAPWHDVQVELRGPAVTSVETVFRERWADPTSPDARNPLAYVRDRLAGARLDPEPLPPQLPAPPEAGPHAVQLLRTYPSVPGGYEFAPDGERSVARGYAKAFSRARRLIYVEDQYLWSRTVTRLLAEAMQRSPRLHVVVVVPRASRHKGSATVTPERLGQFRAVQQCREVGGDRVHVLALENHAGTPVYVHAKVCIVDDVWATVGSDNFNRRSWTHDSELTSAVLDPTRDPREPRDPAGDGDGARVFARDLRLELAREHLDRAADGSEDDDLIDPDRFVTTLQRSAAILEAWHADGCRGPRPPGRLRPHRVQRPAWPDRLWADPVYRALEDPDGRPLRLRLRDRF